jgi:hypothetical protein
MLPSAFLAILLAVYPIKADMTLRFQDISIMQSLAAARLVGFEADIPSFVPPEGRIGALLIEVRGNIVNINASKLYIQGDPIRSLKAFYNRKTDYWYVKAEALGGIIELDGIIPKKVETTQSQIQSISR